MLKHWLNISISNFFNKDGSYAIDTLVFPSVLNAITRYYEVKNFKKSYAVFEDVNIQLCELFIPHGISIKQIFLYKIYLEYLNKTYKFLRILYNLPIRKSRTHNRSNKRRWLNIVSTTYCIRTTPIFKKLKLPKSKVHILFFCEFINSVWFFNWWKDWFSAYKTRVKSVSKNVFIKWKYDAVALQQGRAIFFSIKKKKTKHNRKKSTVLKNTYNIGFYYGFSSIYIKKILSSSVKK